MNCIGKYISEVQAGLPGDVHSCVEDSSFLFNEVVEGCNERQVSVRKCPEDRRAAFEMYVSLTDTLHQLTRKYKNVMAI